MSKVMTNIEAQVAGLDWHAVADALNAHGHAIVPGMLSGGECAAMAALYAQPELFRSRVMMARHGFGSGEYQYFSYPLPPTVATLRQALYAPLAAIANRWHEAMGMAARMQSRVAVAPLRQGDMVVFPVNQRPVSGARGAYRVTMRHGVSPVRAVAARTQDERAGAPPDAPQRHTLGIIFHDAS